jgi:uncharacterized membrane protein
MKNIIIFSIVLAVIFVGVSLLLNSVLGIFIVCLVACMALDLEKKIEHKNTNQKEKA